MINKKTRSYIDLELIKEYKDLFNLKTYEIPDFNGTTESEKLPEFVSYFKKELKSIEVGEYKSYIIETKNVPHLFFGTNDYLMYMGICPAFINKVRVIIFNNQIEHLFKYDMDLSIDKNEFDEIYASNKLCKYFYTLIDYDKSLAPRVINIIKDYTITTYNKNKRITINSNNKKNISDIKYNKENIIVSFNNSFYSKMLLDYNFNIKSLEIHHSIKKKLNITTEIKNITTYNSIVEQLKDNFEWYKLLNDSNYKMPINENNFNNHLEIIKSFTKNKEDIIEQANKVFNFYDSYKFDLDIFNLFKPKFIEKNLFYMNYAESVIGFNPFKTLDYSEFDNFNKYAFNEKDKNEVSTKIFAALLLLKYKKQNPIPIKLIEHVIETSKINNQLIEKHSKDFKHN